MRSVCIGTGGFLGRIDGETRCAFMAATRSVGVRFPYRFDPYM
jgi:hypothetical protein